MTGDRDPSLDDLLFLDGQVFVIDPEGGLWVKFAVRKVPATKEKPHGLDYSLTLHALGGERLAGFDDAHKVRRETMTTLKIGIASYEDMKARAMAIARGELRPKPDDPKVWFTSTESFAKVMSAGNRELLQLIAELHPGSLAELAKASGRKKSNLSRTLRRMAEFGLVALEHGERGRLIPTVGFDKVVLELPLRPHFTVRQSP